MGNKFEVIGGGDYKIGIPLGIDNYEIRSGLYSYFVSMFIEIFLNKYGYNFEDNCWNESFFVFQSIILNCTTDSLKKYLDDKGFEFIGFINIKVNNEKKGKTDFLGKYNEHGDDFDIKQYLEKAKNGELSFGFIPGIENGYAVIFAKPKIQEIEYFTSDMLAESAINTRVNELLANQPTQEELFEASKPGGLLHGFKL